MQYISLYCINIYIYTNMISWEIGIHRPIVPLISFHIHRILKKHHGDILELQGEI